MSPPRAHVGTRSLERLERLERLRQDRARLAEHYPALRFEIDEMKSTAEAAGPLLVVLPDGTREPVEVRIEFEPTYPLRPPRPYDAADRWKPEPDRHIEHDGHLCLFLRGVDAPDLKPDGAILAFVADLEEFLRQQIVLDSQRKFNPHARFPGPEWPHGNLAYEALRRSALATRACRGTCRPVGRGAPLPESALGLPVRIGKRVRRLPFQAVEEASSVRPRSATSCPQL